MNAIDPHNDDGGGKDGVPLDRTEMHTTPAVILDMTFTASREGADGYWAVYDHEHYGFTTAQGRSVEELLRECDDGARCLLSMERGPRPLEPRITLAWTTEEQDAAYLLSPHAALVAALEAGPHHRHGSKSTQKI